MRLFVAVDLAPEAVAEAARVADEIRRRAHADLRWIRPANMHLTVRFIGHVAEHVGTLIATLSKPVDVNPFDLSLAACGAFPPAGAVRVVWIGVGSGVRELTRVSAVMDERLRTFGFEPEARGFSPHLTLARAPRDARIPRALSDTLAHVAVRPMVTRVTQAFVYESRLSPRGAHYEPLAAIPLSGESQLH